MDQYAVVNDDIIIAGDINIHMETNSNHAKQLTELLNWYDLKQNVTEPTHIRGHLLDVIITPNKENYIHSNEIMEIDLSDHFLINFNTAVVRQLPKIKQSNIVHLRQLTRFALIAV